MSALNQRYTYNYTATANILKNSEYRYMDWAAPSKPVLPPAPAFVPEKEWIFLAQLLLCRPYYGKIFTREMINYYLTGQEDLRGHVTFADFCEHIGRARANYGLLTIPPIQDLHLRSYYNTVRSSMAKGQGNGRKLDNSVSKLFLHMEWVLLHRPPVTLEYFK